MIFALVSFDSARFASEQGWSFAGLYPYREGCFDRGQSSCQDTSYIQAIQRLDGYVFTQHSFSISVKLNSK